MMHASAAVAHLNLEEEMQEEVTHAQVTRHPALGRTFVGPDDMAYCEKRTEELLFKSSGGTTAMSAGTGSV
jgi:hypothetical protein